LWTLLADVVLAGKNVVLDPLETALKIAQLGQTVQFWEALGNTLTSAFTSFLVAFILSFIVALLAYFHPFVEQFVRPYITIFRSIPTVAVILVLFLVVDWNYITFVVAFLVTFPLLFEQIVLAFKSVSITEIEAAKSLGLSGANLVVQIYLPNMTLHIISSCQTAFGLNLKVVIAAEVLGIPKTSLGLSILTAKQTFDFSDAWCYLIVTIIIAYLIEKALSVVEHFFADKRVV
jgi:NitT/TauT family transport system permease protein